MGDTASGAQGRVEVVVAVDDSHLAQITQLAAALADLGLIVERRLDAIGVISGLIEEEKLHSLEGVDGVASVEIARQFQLPSPDSPVQ